MKITKLITGIFIITLLFTSQTFAQHITGKGSSVTETIDLPTLTGVSLGIAADVHLKQGSKQEIKITGQKNIIDNIKRKVKGGTWNIGFENRVRNHDDIHIYITISTLKTLSIGGSGSIIGEGRFNDLNDLELSIGGSGDINLDVAANKISCSIGGSGEIELAGSSDKLSISIGGSGDINAFDLNVTRCDISSAGSGDIDVNVSGQLDVSMVGSGDVKYKGNPKVSSSIIGSGDVEKAN